MASGLWVSASEADTPVLPDDPLFTSWTHQTLEADVVVAGGGLKHCGAYGVTDDLAKKPVENPVPLVDFHATIHAALGIDPSKNLGAGSRPVPITDGGKPIAALFG